MAKHIAFTMVPLLNTPQTCTIWPCSPFTVIPCMNGTSGSGLISSLSGSLDPTVYRSTICNPVGGIYTFVPGFSRVQAVESKSLSPDAHLMQAGTMSPSSISLMWAVKLSTALMTLPRFPGSDIRGKVVQAVCSNFPGSTMVA